MNGWCHGNLFEYATVVCFVTINWVLADISNSFTADLSRVYKLLLFQLTSRNKRKGNMSRVLQLRCLGCVNAKRADRKWQPTVVT
jgi:hypothetical protein